MIDKKEIVARLRRLSGASEAELRGFVRQVHGVYEAKIVRWVDLGDGKVNFWVAVAMPVSMADWTPCKQRCYWLSLKYFRRKLSSVKPSGHAITRC